MSVACGLCPEQSLRPGNRPWPNQQGSPAPGPPGADAGGPCGALLVGSHPV